VHLVRLVPYVAVFGLGVFSGNVLSGAWVVEPRPAGVAPKHSFAQAVRAAESNMVLTEEADCGRIATGGLSAAAVPPISDTVRSRVAGKADLVGSHGGEDVVEPESDVISGVAVSFGEMLEPSVAEVYKR